MSSYADNNDLIEVKDNYGESKLISQVGVSKIVEARLREILKFAKNEIKNLTNREISYIIVTGGITELTGFNSVVENTLGINANVINDSIMGIRNNKFFSNNFRTSHNSPSSSLTNYLR